MPDDYGTRFLEWWDKQPESKLPNAAELFEFARRVRNEAWDELKEMMQSLKEELLRSAN